jgi:hypothetical protein
MNNIKSLCKQRQLNLNKNDPEAIKWRNVLKARTLAIRPRLAAHPTNVTRAVCNIDFRLYVLWTERTKLRDDEEEVRRHFPFPKLVDGFNFSLLFEVHAIVSQTHFTAVRGGLLTLY